MIIFDDAIIIDSLNLCSTGESKEKDTNPAFLKHKLKTVGERFTNFATTFGTRVLTVTQASDVDQNKWNDPSFCLTRSNTEGDKTLVQPFSYVFTSNRTKEEIKKATARIYIDKLRSYNPKDQVYHICTDYEHGNYYSPRRTKAKFLIKEDEV